MNHSSWILITVAGVFEVCWAVGLKYTAGFTRLWPSVFTLATLAASMFLLAKAAERLPIGTAYGVWVGIGSVGAAILGVILFKEPLTLARVFFLALLIIAIIGLKLSTPSA